MQWPQDWIIIEIDGHKIHAAPEEYIQGLFQIVTGWQDPNKRNHAFGLLAAILQNKTLPAGEYEVRTKALAVATVYASVGLASPDACDWCIDTLEPLVP